MRKNLLAVGETHHIFTRSIADYKVFNNHEDFERIQHLIKFYMVDNKIRFSDFIIYKKVHENGINNTIKAILKDKEKLVQIIAYCFMPTHIHLILKQLTDKGISKYMNNILNSYTRYFNTLHKRKGPLWESRFKNVLVNTDEYLLHLTRYIHLNPVSSSLVKNPEDWPFSSYNEYIMQRGNHEICQFNDVLEINVTQYRKFVNDRISYQKELSKIKKIIIE